MTNEGAPGWDAIQAVFEELYPSAAPLHSGAKRDRSVDARFAVQAWRSEAVWHLTTLGLSELWDKHSERAEVSGWGMEITMLLPREAGQERLPTWPIGLLRGLAEMVDQAKMVPEPGHRVDLRRPINTGSTSNEDRQLTALMFVLDDQLGEQGKLDTPNGSLRFLRVVGISSKELAQPEDQLRATLAGLQPPNITDPRRRSG